MKKIHTEQLLHNQTMGNKSFIKPSDTSDYIQSQTKSTELISREKEFVKRIRNMKNTHFICPEIKLSKELKKFTDNWKIILKIFSIYDNRHICDAEIYTLTFFMNGQITCTCNDYKLKAQQLNIGCKHILYILEKNSEINYSILLENGFILNKQILEQY